MNDIEIDVLSILSELGIDGKVRYNHFKGCCPFHSEKTPSWTIELKEPYRYHCFGCGTSGNIFSLYRQKTGESLYKKEGLEYESLIFSSTLTKKKEKKEIEDRVEIIDGKLLDIDVSEEALNYLIGRGCTKEFIDYYNMKYTRYCRIQSIDDRSKYTDFYNRIVTPLYFKNKIQSYEGRDFTKKSKAKVLYPIDSSIDYLFNYDRLDKNEILIVTEGIFDLFSIFSLGYRNITCTLGAGVSDLQIKMLNEFKYKWIFPDNDKAGIMLIDRYIKEFNHDFHICFPPNGKKDAGDCSTEEIQKAIHNKIGSVDYKFNKYDLETKIEW